MAGLLRKLLLGTALLFQLSCDALLNEGLVLTSTPQTSQVSPLSFMDLDLDGEEQPEITTVPGRPTMVPGVSLQGQDSSQQDTSQESSGFYSEDSEDKPLSRSVYLWDDIRKQINNPSFDKGSIKGYKTSSSTVEGSREGNHSSPVMAAVENLDRELWEMERESSGLPLQPGDDQDPPATPHSAAAGPVDSTTLDPQYVPVHGGSEATSDDLVEEELKSTTDEPDTSNSSPTLPEVGEFPSLGPLQPLHTMEDDGRFPGSPGSDSGRVGAGEDIFPLTIVPSASLAPVTVSFQGESWGRLGGEAVLGGLDAEERRMEEEQEAKHGGMGLLMEGEVSQKKQQVICVDWRDTAGKGYVSLNMSDNIKCDEFRRESGDRLLELMETAFSRKMNSPRGSWLISLSKPSVTVNQLLIIVSSKHGVINTKDVLSMFGEIRRDLHEIGILNYSSPVICHYRSSQTHSDYGKLFVVLVIIGSVCVLIITFGLIYICWQRRLPKIKTMTRGEELHFVENGCHDNPTLDVTGDGVQPEMQEKKPHTLHNANGLPTGPGVVGGPRGEAGSTGWQVLVNKPGGEEDSMEEDTHL
ncbi:hypothetical protein UPYG_G00163620 [Umbra pygmaea]|uniref:Podocalyxin-like protein 2 n=1 Tax=Umbra pygmaea TaxID=75934 RepID=A0ABD0WM49_UMBPY